MNLGSKKLNKDPYLSLPSNFQDDLPHEAEDNSQVNLSSLEEPEET